MRVFPLITAFALTCAVHSFQITPAHGECYGDAAAAYGCGVPAREAPNTSGRARPSLEQFGNTERPVLPDLGYYDQPSSSTDVITPEERHRMMRNIVLGKGGVYRSRRAHNSAIESAARPIRRSGSMPVRTR